MVRSTRIRLPAEQTSPWLTNTPKSAPSTAASKSASAKKMLGDFPPSSREIFFSVAAAARMMLLPTSTLPVNAILSTSGCSTSAAPVAGPPVTMLTTPDGRPASLKLAASSRIVSGVCSAGFRSVVRTRDRLLRRWVDRVESGRRQRRHETAVDVELVSFHEARKVATESQRNSPESHRDTESFQNLRVSVSLWRPLLGVSVAFLLGNYIQLLE